MESTVGSCYTFFPECSTLCKQESALSNVQHMFQWICHFIDKGFARFEGPFDSKIAIFSKLCSSNLEMISIQPCKTAYISSGMLWFLKWFSKYVGGFCLKLGSNAIHLSKNATTFCKELLHTLRNGVCFFFARSFYKCCLQIHVCSTIYRQHIAWIGACSECWGKLL